MQISLARTRLQALGADTRLMGTFCDNHDSDRFLSARCDFGAGVRAWVATLSSLHRSAIACSAGCGHACWLLVHHALNLGLAPCLLQGQPARLPQCTGIHPAVRVHSHHVRAVPLSQPSLLDSLCLRGLHACADLRMRLPLILPVPA